MPGAVGRSLRVVAAIGLALAAGTTAGARPGRPGGSDRLACRDPHQTAQTSPTFTAPAPGNRLVLGRVWLPKASAVLGWPRRPNTGSSERFLKHGIVVTAGSPITLTIPPSAASTYAFSFDSDHAADTVGASRMALVVQPCPLGHATAWPGGYLAVRPACVPLIVSANGRSTEISLALGRAC